MKKRDKFVVVSWILFGVMLVVGIVTAIMMFYTLSQQEPLALDSDQSRIELHWGYLQTIWLVSIVILSGLLTFLWNRIKPFHVALLCMLAGAIYFLFFLTFTVGWVILQGMIGLVVGIVVGMVLIISRVIYVSVQRKRKR
jgi:signal transduction histidine kinase